MAEITAILVAGGSCVVGLEAWYALWHRRTAASLKRVPLRPGADRPPLGGRKQADPPAHAR
jgi:hypothetical protein